MRAPNRRVILKPPGVARELLTLLGEGLAEAVQRQRGIASKCPSILRFTSALQEDGQSFHVEHEPASAVVTAATLFDPTQPVANADELVAWAVALFDALRTDPDDDPGRPWIHGGISAGVLLVTSEGERKITDFGFAPAICRALGVEAYQNIALACDPGDSSNPIGTGVWEVLPPDEFDREDRLCPFIDPQKYGTGDLGTFEHGSDVFAAACLLHLFAEHTHPYLTDSDAHRMAEMSEYMAALNYSGARRRELRESPSAQVKSWCDIVARALSRLPRHRPTAAEALDKLPAPDPAEAERRRRSTLEERLAVAEARLDELAPGASGWKEVRQAAEGILEGGDAGGVLEVRARALLAQASAAAVLARAAKQLQQGGWLRAKEHLAELGPRPTLPKNLSDRLVRIEEEANRWLGVQKELADIQAGLERRSPQTADAKADLASLEELSKRLAEFAPDKEWPAALSAGRDVLLHEIDQARQSARRDLEKARAEIAADHAAAAAWFEGVERDLRDERWSDLEHALASGPELTHWPPEIAARVEAARTALRDHVALEERVRAARIWIDKANATLEAERWEDAPEALSAAPAPGSLPTDLEHEVRTLAAALREALNLREDRRRAQDWLERLRAAGDREDWSGVDRLVANRPAIQHWPAEILAAEQQLRARIDQQLEAIQQERLRIETDHRRAEAWLGEARGATQSGAWDQALRILGHRPQLTHWPEGIDGAAAELVATCAHRLEEDRVRLHEERAKQAREAAGSFLREQAGVALGALLSPELLQVTAEEPGFLDEQQFDSGEITLHVQVRGAKKAAPDLVLAFSFEGEQITVADPQGRARKLLVEHLTNLVTATQKARMEQIQEQLRRGPFPRMTLSWTLDQPTARLPIRARLAEIDGEGDVTEAELCWSPAELKWTGGRGALLVRAAELIAHAARTALTADAHRASTELERYLPHCSAEVTDVGLKELGDLGAPVRVTGRITLSGTGDDARHVIAESGGSCRNLEDISFELEPRRTTDRLHQVLIGVQQSARSALLQTAIDRGSAAGFRVRSDALPATIDRPIDETRVAITVGRAGRTELHARWDPGSLSFVPGGDWEAALDEAITAARARKGRPRLMLPLGLTAAAVVGLAVVGYSVWSKSPAPDPRRPSPGSSGPATPVVDPGTSPEPAPPGPAPPGPAPEAYAAAEAWLQETERAVREEGWADVDERLKQQPDLVGNLPELAARAETVRQAFQQHLDLQRINDVRSWILSANQALQGESAAAIRQVQRNLPTLDGLPTDLAQEVRSLSDELDEALLEFELQRRTDTVLDVVKRRLPDSHWLRQAAPNAQFVKGKRVDDRWLVVVGAAPWADSSTDPSTLPPGDQLVLTVDLNQIDPNESTPPAGPNWLARPNYWPLIEFYHDRQARLPALIRGAQPPNRQRPDANWKHLAIHIIPTDQPPTLTRDPDPELQLVVTRQWVAVEEGIRSLLDPAALHEELAERIDPNNELPPEETATLTVVEPDQVVPVGVPLQGFFERLDGQRSLFGELDRALGELARRHRTEEELLGALGGQRSLAFDPNEQEHVLQLLRSIWTAKGTASQVADLVELGRELDARLPRAPNKKPGVPPTVLVEYFCGPRSTFALICSIAASPDGTRGIVEGPKLLLLGETSRLLPIASGADAGGAPGDDLGEILIGKVLRDSVPQALGPYSALLQDPPFQGRLGVVLALDERIGLAAEPPEALRFDAPIDSRIEPLDVSATEHRFERVRWHMLRELSGSPSDPDPWKGEYWLVRSLAQPASTWSGTVAEDRRAAWTVIEAAMPSAGD
jgi:hypothetical protein